MLFTNQVEGLRQDGPEDARDRSSFRARREQSPAGPTEEGGRLIRELRSGARRFFTGRVWRHHVGEFDLFPRPTPMLGLPIQQHHRM